MHILHCCTELKLLQRHLHDQSDGAHAYSNILKTGGGGGGEVLSRRLARVFRCIQAAWYPGAGVNETWAGHVLVALGLDREAHGVEVMGVFVSRREFTWDRRVSVRDDSSTAFRCHSWACFNYGTFAELHQEALSLEMEYGQTRYETACAAICQPDVRNSRPQRPDWRAELKREILEEVKGQIQELTLEVMRELRPPITATLVNHAPSQQQNIPVPRGRDYQSMNRWDPDDEVMESIPTGERVVIGADFNGHVGEGNTGDEEVMGKFGVKERNLERQTVIDFAKRMDMAVVNTYSQKREEHRVTYKSGGRSTQVDFILCRRGNLKEISDCKVVMGESVARQHRMVVCRMTLMVCKKKRSEMEKKTKWWKLKKKECCEEFRQKLRQALGGQVVLPDDWETTAEVIRETGRMVLGVSSERRKEDKKTWWWNEEVQGCIQRKRLAKKKWDMDRTEENRQEYK
ncbi:hypothetical protein QTP86_000287 [Hemibagrus guttatus]|nr:hypothetical protein QTP86_000287 [Hemibagrus guttatus]